MDHDGFGILVYALLGLATIFVGFYALDVLGDTAFKHLYVITAMVTISVGILYILQRPW